MLPKVSTADCVWCQCRPESGAAPRPRSVPPATESAPSPPPKPRGTDCPERPTRICAISFASEDYKSKKQLLLIVYSLFLVLFKMRFTFAPPRSSPCS